MNKSFRVVWNESTQTWQAVSELVKATGKKSKSIVLLVSALGVVSPNVADAATAIDPAYAEIKNQTTTITIGDVYSYGAQTAIGIGANTHVTLVGENGQISIEFVPNRNRPPGKGPITWAAAAINNLDAWVTPVRGLVAKDNVAINVLPDTLDAQGGPRQGVASLWGANFTFEKDLKVSLEGMITGRRWPEHYGIIAGSSNNTPDGMGNDKFSSIKIGGDYTASISMANPSAIQTIAGIRSIGGDTYSNSVLTSRNSSGYVEIDGKTTINMNGAYAEGIYVSGGESKVILNGDSAITMLNGLSGSAALKIGKSLDIGSDTYGKGKGELVSKGKMELDTTQSDGVAIQIRETNSTLMANADTASMKIRSKVGALTIGALDWITRNNSENIQVHVKDADWQASDVAAQLMNVGEGQSKAVLAFSGDKTALIAPNKGWLLSVEGTVAKLSDLTMSATNAGQMTGLTSKAEVSTLNINLDDNFSWNLREHTAASGSLVKTSTFNTTTLKNSAVINAIKGNGTAAFELKGDVVSQGGIIRLSDATTTALVSNGQATAGDVLTITGNYTATNGKVLLDTKLGDDSSATDLLHITGNSTGTNTLEVTPVVASLGDLTKQGIKVVQVDGTSDQNTNYTLKGDGVVSADSLTVGADNKHKFTYRLYQGTLNHPGTGNGIPAGVNTTGIDTNDWYLRSVCSNGSHHVGRAFTASTYDGLGCIANDTITVTSGANIAKVEGAGGMDTILINSDAKVSGDVYGGNAGVDNSTDKDSNDTITVTDNATVIGAVYAQTGDDTIVWSGASKIAGLDGGIGSDIAVVSSRQYDGTQILDGGDDVAVADGWVDTLNLKGVKVTANGGNIRNWETVALTNGSEWTLAGTLTTGNGKNSAGAQIGLQIDNSSTLAISGTAAKVVGDVSNAGTIDLTRDGHTPSQTLTINGDYIGSVGSKVKMNTVWNKTGDAKGANSQSDILTITGSATGQTSVVPVSSDGKDLVISGNVEQISTVINTIPVITVGKTGSDRVFIGSAVTPRGIEAQLAKRVVNGVDQYFWTIDSIKTPVGPVVPSNPTYDPRVPGYALMSRVNMEQGYATLRTLHERRGENQTLAWDNCGTCGEQANGQTWGRLIGSNLEVDGKYRLGFETKSYGFQFGHDFAITRTDEGGHRLTGAYVSYNHANTTFKDEFSRENGELLADKAAGKGKSNAWSLGVTHTRYSPFGAYLDLVGQVSFYRNKYEPRKYNDVSQNGMGVVLSAEVGKPYALSDRQPGESGWMIEPQAQLIYQTVNLNDVNDGTRRVDQGVEHGLRGRIGARLAYNEQAEKDVYRTDTFYAVANIWHDFVKPSTVKLAGNKIREEHASTWAEVGIGMQLPIRKQTYIYGDVRYERELGGTKREGYRGTVGLKYTWK